MAFTPLLTVFCLAIGSPFPGQAVSLDLQQSSPSVHHRTKRQEPNSRCDVGDGLFKWNNGNCYYFSSDYSNVTTPLTWNAAQEACEIFGMTEKTVGLAELGNPNNLISDGWLMEQIKHNDKEVWLGAHDPDQSDVWIWISETTTSRTLSLDNAYWGPYQPNNHKGVEQYCLSTIKEGDKVPPRQYLNDAHCDDTFNYVCQLFK